MNANSVQTLTTAGDTTTVTRTALEKAIRAALQPAFERNGGTLDRKRHFQIVLDATAQTCGGRLHSDHPLAAVVIGEMTAGYGLTTVEHADKHISEMKAALAGWPGRWEWDRIRPATRKAFNRQFAEDYDRGEHWVHGGTDAIVEGLLLREMPCVVAGRSKSMKTTMAADLAAALITGTPFLGMETHYPEPVLYLSRERTPASVRRLIDTSAERRERDRPADHERHERRGVLTTDAGELLTTDAGRKRLKAFLDSGGAGVVLIDPAYLFLGGANTSDLAAMGKRLRHLCQPVIDGGATPVVLHHTTRSAPVGEWPRLDDLSGAGMSEYFRTWLMVSREKEYDGGHVHALMALAGTCEGDYARLRVRLDETTMTATATPDTPTLPTRPGRRAK